MSKLEDLMAKASKDTTDQTVIFLEFERLLLAEDDPQLVWDLFVDVRRIVVKRLYEHVDNLTRGGAQRDASPQTTRQPAAGSGGAHSTAATQRVVQPTGTRGVTVSGRPRGRSAETARASMMAQGARLSALDTVRDHNGVPLGMLTYVGVERFGKLSAVYRVLAGFILETGLPNTGRKSDVVENYVTPDEADTLLARARAQCMETAA